MTGIPINEAAAWLEKSHSAKEKFIPVVSGAHDPDRVGCHLLVKVKDSEALAGDAEHPGTFDGMLVRNDLPGALHMPLERDGIIKGDDYYVLYRGETPASTIQKARILAYLGGALAVMGVSFALFDRFRAPTQPADRRDHA